MDRSKALALLLTLPLSGLAGLAGCGGAQGGAGAVSVAPAEPRQCARDAMRPGTGESNEATIASAIAGCHRTVRSAARDVYRHPAETLAFLGLSPEMDLLELAPGGGWYTDILAPVVRDEGSLTATLGSLQGPRAESYRRYLSEHQELYGEVDLVEMSLEGPIQLGAPESYDMALTFRNLHNWHGRGLGVDGVFRAVFAALRPGGVFGVVEHRADEGADVDQTASQGYMPEAWVIQRAQAAGFVLEESSEINANPQDTHEHPSGVWTLPPALRLGDQDRERYLAIGESDRMTLRFRKPEGAAEAATGATE